jgi:hypothetical protein
LPSFLSIASNSIASNYFVTISIASNFSWRRIDELIVLALAKIYFPAGYTNRVKCTKDYALINLPTTPDYKFQQPVTSFAYLTSISERTG